MYITRLSSPVGVLLLAADGIALTGLWMEGQKYFAATLSKDAVEQPDLPVFRQTAQWLSAYFDGAPLPAMPPLAPQGSAFRQAVWNQLRKIPYGQVTTYGVLTGLCGSRVFPPRRRQSVALWGITRFPFSFPATGSWGRTAALPAMQAAWIRSDSCWNWRELT